jgi:hypothetical protein
VRLTLFTLTRVYSTIFPSHVISSHYITTLSLKRKLFCQFYVPPSIFRITHRLCGFARAMHLCPCSRNSRLCQTLSLVLETIAHAHILHICAYPRISPCTRACHELFASYSMDSRPCLHLAHFFILQGLLSVPASLHHTTPSSVLIPLVKEIDTLTSLLVSQLYSMLRHHSIHKLKHRGLSSTILH